MLHVQHFIFIYIRFRTLEYTVGAIKVVLIQQNINNQQKCSYSENNITFQEGQRMITTTEKKPLHRTLSYNP